MKYQVADKTFNTVKEASKYSNEIEWKNREYMFEPSKRIDATIKGIDNNN